MPRFSGTLTFVLTATLCLLPACSDQGDPLGHDSICGLSDSSLQFGIVLVGESADRTTKVTNGGGAPLQLNVESACADFQIISGAGARELQVGGELEILVRFTPPAEGEHTCQISLGIECGVVSASGRGVLTAVSFASDIQPIFDASCALSSCHVVPTLTGDLNLSSGASFAQLVGAESKGYAPALRVDPGDPGASVLFNKVADTNVHGPKMPPRGSLSVAQVEAIRSWIANDAPDN